MGWWSNLFSSKAVTVEGVSDWIWHDNPEWVTDGVKGRWKKTIKVGRRTMVEMQVIEYRDAEHPPAWAVEIGGAYGKLVNMEILADVDEAKAAVEYAVVYLSRRARRL
jgi:hypothetical protein